MRINGRGERIRTSGPCLPKAKGYSVHLGKSLIAITPLNLPFASSYTPQLGYVCAFIAMA